MLKSVHDGSEARKRKLRAGDEDAKQFGFRDWANWKHSSAVFLLQDAIAKKLPWMEEQPFHPSVGAEVLGIPTRWVQTLKQKGKLKPCPAELRKHLAADIDWSLVSRASVARSHYSLDELIGKEHAAKLLQVKDRRVEYLSDRKRCGQLRKVKGLGKRTFALRRADVLRLAKS